jgi:hypothetical protein
MDQNGSSRSVGAVPSFLLRCGAIPRLPSGSAHGTRSLAGTGTRSGAPTTSANNDWDRAWVPKAYSSGDADKAFEEDDDDEGANKDEDDDLDFSVFDDSCQPPQPQSPSPPAPAGSCDVSSHVHDGRVVRDDTKDFVGNVADTSQMYL